jgi:CRP-like cAMP-binding protein
MGKYVNFLKETELFYNLTQEQLEQVESICEVVDYEKGAMIVSESSREDELYLILRGEAEVLIDPTLVQTRNAPASEPHIVSILRRGQSFGEIALVDQGVRSASVRCSQRNTRMLRIPRQRLLELCETYPDLGYRVLFNLAADLAQKIRNSDLRIREALLSQQFARPSSKA